MLRVRDSIIDSSDGASLYNVICKQSAANGDCFNTLAKTFINTTGSNNVSADGSSDIHIANLFDGFVDPANNDYRIKKSFAETELVGKGWNGEDIVNWAYYDETASNDAYSIQLGGLKSLTDVDLNRITKDAQTTVNGYESRVVARAQGLFSKEHIATNQGARGFFEMSQSNFNHQRAMRFSSTRVHLPLAATILAKDWSQSLPGSKVRAQSDTVRLTKDWLMSAAPISVKVNGESLLMEYVELFHHSISLGAVKSTAKLDELITTKDRTVKLRSSKALGVGGTMYVYRDIQTKLGSISFSSKSDELKVTADRLMTVNSSTAGTFATSNMLFYSRTLHAGGAYTESVIDELDMYANIVVPLSQTNKLSGYSVSFEINPVSVIYDFE